MKKIITLALLCLSVLCYAQQATGYQQTNQLDTVKILLLVSHCDTCAVHTRPGFAVRQKSVYIGDRMPGESYGDVWNVKALLDERKKAMDTTVVFWNYKVKQ